MAKAYSYIRFSTLEQSKGDSFRRQTEMSDAYAQKHGLEIDDSLRITDLGKSAYKEKHLTEGALGAFILAVEEGRVERGSYLLVESFDRLSRAAVPKALRLFLTLLEAGITIVTLADERSYSEESTSGDLTEIITSIVFMGRAWEESQRKSDRLARTWAQKRKQLDTRKLTGMCPAWLKRKEDWSGFDLIEDRVKIVREIFQAMQEGFGHSAIARRLNARREPTWSTGKKKSAGWHPSYISKITENRAAIGHFQPHRYVNGKRVPIGEEVLNYFPTVVSEPVFFSVQNRKPRPPGKFAATVTNLFTNLVWDGYHENAVMHYADKGSHARGKGRWCYLVSDYRRIVPSSTKVWWKYPHFEACFLKFIDSLDWSVVTGQTKSDELSLLEGNVAVVEGRRDDMVKRIEKLVDALSETDEPPAALLTRIKANEMEKSEIEAELKELQRKVRRLQAAEKSLTENVDQLRSLVTSAKEPKSFDARTRLREELRRKIRCITVYPFGWPQLEETGKDSETGEPQYRRRIPEPHGNPGFSVEFSNGCSTYVTCSPMGRGPKAPEVNANPSARVIRFVPAGSGKNPLDGIG